MSTCQLLIFQVFLEWRLWKLVLLSKGVFLILLGSSLFKVLAHIHEFAIVVNTWIYQNCQFILLFLLSWTMWPLSQAGLPHLTRIWLIPFSPCSFCMSPNSNLLIYLFFPSFLSVLLLLLRISGTCFSLSQTPHAVLLLKGFLSHLLDTQPMVCFAFILKDTPLLHPFFYFSFISKCGVFSIIHFSALNFSQHLITLYCSPKLLILSSFFFHL